MFFCRTFKDKLSSCEPRVILPLTTRGQQLVCVRVCVCVRECVVCVSVSVCVLRKCLVLTLAVVEGNTQKTISL